MQSQPQNPEFWNNPETFTHDIIYMFFFYTNPFRISIIIGLRFYNHFIIHCIYIEAN